MGSGILAESALIPLLGILHILSHWGQGKQFYCRRFYEPERQLSGESVAHSIWGPPRKGPAEMSTGPAPGCAERPGGWVWRVVPLARLRASLASRNIAAGTSTSSRPTAAPAWEVEAQEEGHTGLESSAGGGSEAGAQIGSSMPGPRQLRRPGQRVAGRHSPASHELGTRAPDSPDTVQHRRHPRPTRGSPRTPCVAASRVEPRSHAAAVRVGGADE